MRIAILTNNDTVWALPTWAATIPLLEQSGHQVIGLHTCSDRVGSHTGIKIPIYYFKTFGSKNFLLLFVFSIFQRLKTIIKFKLTGFKQLCHKYKIPYRFWHVFNQREFANWLIENNIDILFIMVGFIIKKDILSAVNVATINKHSSLLPNFRGLFPFLWAHLHNAKQGVSLHSVSEQIDSGNILIQKIVPQSCCGSMISFYKYVFNLSPNLYVESINHLNDNNTNRKQEEPLNSKHYFGLPTKNDYQRFKEKNGVIIFLSDIL